MVDIDLDRLADAYRLRPMSHQARQRAVMSARGCRGWLLDIGGGPGRHAATWNEPSQHPVVVDPSSGMLGSAAQHAGLELVRAESRRLPFRSHSCALAYFHLSIHYGDWSAAIDEALRVVEHGGRIEVWTIPPDAMERSSLGRWFPRVVEIDTARFPDPVDIAEYGVSQGGSARISEMSEPIVRTVGDWQNAVRGRFVSTLQLLDDDEIDAGLDRFRSEFPDDDGRYCYELELARISIVV